MCQHINSNEVLTENLRPYDTSRTYYLLTIVKSQRKDVIYQADIDKVYDYLKWNLQSLHVHMHCYEIDSTYNQLHSHAIISIDQYFKFLHYNTFKGFYIKWDIIDKINDDFKWVNRYLHKDAHNKYIQEEILTRNYYNNNYGFL